MDIYLVHTNHDWGDDYIVGAFKWRHVAEDHIKELQKENEGGQYIIEKLVLNEED